MTEFAVIAPLVWLGWLILTDWVPMFPLNDLGRGNARTRLVAAAVNYPIPLLIAGGVVLHETWSLIGSVALSGLCLAGHLYNWWLPYFGVSSAAQRELYQREYARTWKILPTTGRAVVIDVQHMVVGLLTIVMLGSTIVVAVAA